MLSRSTPFGALGDRLSIPSSAAQPFAGFEPAPPHLFHRIEDAFTRRPDSASILQGVRAFRKGRPHVRVVLVPSPKNGQHFIACEGRLEAGFALSLEIDPDVMAFRTQPFLLPSSSGRALVCDFAIQRSDHSYVVVDVKPKGQLERESVKQRMRIVRAALSDAGIPHRTITEVKLERQPARDIREHLRKGASILLSPFGREQLLTALGTRLVRVSELRVMAITLGLPVLSVERLALLGDLTFPISAPWRESTLIGATHGTDHSASHGWGTVRDVRVPV
ncbi:TnsA endonuclease N-terminal domain-containing protein [uncultured Nevskia sp.]|uniref:TnsA endonuclease N-terminal domain-containing protein n=1 Tax=uncultured Nevskia sp. TaxID=228950 RepID=UPI0025FE1D16|nr:TnsA endonuclease N-terminal domain-containing protein [uncultured Nevskia sp.]